MLCCCFNPSGYHSSVWGDELTQPRVILKTGEQYAVWKERVSILCWSLTKVDVFQLTDLECAHLTRAYQDRKEGDHVIDVVGKCYPILTSYLSDEMLLKVAHVPKGQIGSLIAEIRASLAVSTIEDVQPLRVDLYNACMVRDCRGDLQSYISYIGSRGTS